MSLSVKKGKEKRKMLVLAVAKIRMYVFLGNDSL